MKIQLINKGTVVYEKTTRNLGTFRHATRRHFEKREKTLENYIKRVKLEYFAKVSKSFDYEVVVIMQSKMNKKATIPEVNWVEWLKKAS